MQNILNILQFWIVAELSLQKAGGEKFEANQTLAKVATSDSLLAAR